MVPLGNLYLVSYVEDSVVFLACNWFDSDNFYINVYLSRNAQEICLEARVFNFFSG